MDIFEIHHSVYSAQELNNTIRMRVKQNAIPSMFDEEIFPEESGKTSPIIAMRSQLIDLYATHHYLQSLSEVRDVVYASNKPVIGKAIVFCKRAYRKLTRWLLAPYIYQINRFHATTVQALGDVIRMQEQLLESLERRLDE